MSDTKLAHGMVEAAEQAGISRAQLYIYIRNNVGPRVTKIGRRSVILHEDLQAWLRGLRDNPTKKTVRAA